MKMINFFFILFLFLANVCKESLLISAYRLIRVYKGWSKKRLWCNLEEKCLWNSKIFFDGVFLSIYSHLLKKLELSKSWKWLVRNLKNSLSKFFSFFKLTTRKIFDYKEIFLLFYVAKSISFEVISVLKICTFAAALIILSPLLQFLT